MCLQYNEVVAVKLLDLENMNCSLVRGWTGCTGGAAGVVQWGAARCLGGASYGWLLGETGVEVKAALAPT